MAQDGVIPQQSVSIAQLNGAEESVRVWLDLLIEATSIPLQMVSLPFNYFDIWCPDSDVDVSQVHATMKEYRDQFSGYIRSPFRM
jgi:hypothetical protein